MDMDASNLAGLSPWLEKSFGQEGEVNLNRLLSISEYTRLTAYSMMLVADNASIISADANGPALIKLDRHGRLATDFGLNATGVVHEDYSQEGEGAIVSIRPLYTLSVAGKILSIVMCRTAGGDEIPGCGRYLADGTPDPSFNGTGKKVLVELSLSNNPASMSPQAATLEQIKHPAHVTFAPGASIGADKITILCSYRNVSYLVRLSNEGTLDESFNGTGFSAIAYKGTTLNLLSLTRYDASHWILTGDAPAVGELPAIGIVAKIDGHGQPDPRFGDQGFVRVNQAGQNSSKILNSLVVADESLWITCVMPLNSEFSDQPQVLRILQNGDIDMGFASVPWFERRHVGAMNMAAAPTAGERWVSANYFETDAFTGVIARLLPDGSADESFGSQGYLSHREFQTLDALAVQNDGNCLVLGMDYIYGLDPRWPTMVRRFKAAGSDGPTL